MRWAAAACVAGVAQRQHDALLELASRMPDGQDGRMVSAGCLFGFPAQQRPVPGVYDADGIQVEPVPVLFDRQEDQLVPVGG